MAKAEGIPPTASVVVPGLSLNYLGSHCYAFSGLLSAHSTPAEALNFTTGAGYIVGELQFNGAVDDDNPAARSTSMAVIYFNDVGIAIIASGTSAIDALMSVSTKLIIPPFTHVKVTVDADSIVADEYMSVTIAGRVYDV